MPFIGQLAGVLATTGFQLTAATTAQINASLTITALTANTKHVYVGTSIGVTTTAGYPLPPGVSVTFPKALFSDGTSVYVIAAADTQGVAYYGV